MPRSRGKVIHLELKGTREMEKALRKLGDKAEFAMKRALTTEAEKVMAIAKRLTPVDTGALRASGHVQRPVVDKNKIEVTLGFGGSAASYAIFVHERTELRHTVGQAKFLEQPVNEAARGLADRLAQELRREL
mgnify:CR=1 FL=1